MDRNRTPLEMEPLTLAWTLTLLKDVVLTGVRSVESAELKVVENVNMWKVNRSQLGKVVHTTQELYPVSDLFT